MRVVIPGGSGYLGKALTERLVARGDEVVILTRGPETMGEGWRTVRWDAATLGSWTAELAGADAVVHLTGRRVDTRSTRRNVDELITSRVGPVALVGEAIRRLEAPPPVWVQASSLAIFGDTGDRMIDEQTVPSGLGPREMVTVCLAWEAAFHQATEDVDRAVLLRVGIGLGGPGDPATRRLATLVRLGLGGRVAGGCQWVSWAHVDDVIDAFLRALDQPMNGLYHVTAPNPISNADMMAVYRRLLGVRLGLPSPGLLARVGAPLLGSSAALALTGRRCVPTRLEQEGFEFGHTDFEATARHALERTGFL